MRKRHVDCTINIGHLSFFVIFAPSLGIKSNVCRVSVFVKNIRRSTTPPKNRKITVLIGKFASLNRRKTAFEVAIVLTPPKETGGSCERKVLVVSYGLKKSNFNRVAVKNIDNSFLLGRCADNVKSVVNIASVFFHMNNVLMIFFCQRY